MRLYKVRVEQSHTGATIGWATSIKRANALVKEYRAGGIEGEEYYGSTIDPIEFQLSRKGVLRLLMSHTPGTDNG